MKNALIIHGRPTKEGYYDNSVGSPSNMHWLPWLQHQLIIRDTLAQTPEMPKPYEPVYEDWLAILKQFEVSSDTILVGHSAGAGFLVRYLSENDVQVGRVVLVAPSLGHDWDDRTMFDFTLKPTLVNQTAGITVMVADDDRDGIQQAVAQLEETVSGVKVRHLESGGHLTYKELGHIEFPELLEEVLA